MNTIPFPLRRSMKRADDSARTLEQQEAHASELMRRLEVDAQVLKYIITTLLQGDRQQQDAVIERYIDDDITFVHLMGSAKGKKNVYYIYRCATFWMRYESLEFVKILVDDDSAVVWVNCRVGNWLFRHLVARVYPIITFVTFKKDEAGKTKIAVQLDHHSSYALITMYGYRAHIIFSTIINPLLGLGLIFLGMVADWLIQISDLMHQQYRSWLHYFWSQYKSMCEHLGVHFLAEDAPLQQAVRQIAGTCDECHED